MPGSATSNKNGSSKDKPKSRGKTDKNGVKKKPSHYCSYHGPNWSHNTSECRALKNKDQDGKLSNKTWTCKADESTSKSKKELAAFLAKSIQKQVKKELASIQKKKCKSNDSDDEEGECHLVDILDSDLKGFNYEDMEKLAIDDSDKVSV